MPSEAAMCCGQVADKAKLVGDQRRVVAAFDELDERQKQFDYMNPDIEGLEKAFNQLRDAVICLRE